MSYNGLLLQPSKLEMRVRFPPSAQQRVSSEAEHPAHIRKVGISELPLATKKIGKYFFYSEISYYLYSPLAQLVERLFYMQDVVGSIPAGTTFKGLSHSGNCRGL